MICTANTALYFQCGVSASPVKKGQKKKSILTFVFVYTISKV